jgi:hypothetical protein
MKNTIETVPEITPEPVIQKTPVVQSKPNYWKIICLILLVIVLILGGVLALIMKYQNSSKEILPKALEESKKDVITESDKITPLPTPDFSKNKPDLVYLKDGGLWLSDSSGNSKRITNTEQSVYLYEASTNNSIIVYANKEKPTNNEYTLPNSVYIYFLQTEETKIIYELKPQVVPDTEYYISIRDIGISADGTKVAITTNDSLFLYDVLSGSLKEIFSYPVKFPTTEVPILAFTSPTFSPDNSKLFFHKGYIEGGSYGWVDLTTKKVTNLPYSGYISGKRIIAWFDNSSLIIDEYEMDPPSSLSSKILVERLLDQTQLNFLVNFNGSTSSIIYVNNKLYAIKENNTIVEFDLNTKKLRDTYINKEDHFNGRLVVLSKLKTSLNGDKLFFTKDIQSKSIIMVLDLVKGGEPQDLIQNASF